MTDFLSTTSPKKQELYLFFFWNKSFKWYTGPDGFHRYLQNFTSKRNWIHILLKYVWNFLQKRPHTGSQIRSQPIPKDWDCPLHISNHNALKLELNHKKKFGRNPNTWRLKSIPLKDERVNQEIREELKVSWKLTKMKIQVFKIFEIQPKRS